MVVVGVVVFELVLLGVAYFFYAFVTATWSGLEFYGCGVNRMLHDAAVESGELWLLEPVTWYWVVVLIVNAVFWGVVACVAG